MSGRSHDGPFLVGLILVVYLVLLGLSLFGHYRLDDLERRMAELEQKQ